ncbi:MAG: hypothetical protein ACOYX1_02840 [Acidobacteriota bacterium]
MSPPEKPLAELAAASEELLHLLRRRDPRYLEALERRDSLLPLVARLCASAETPPGARSALERIRQLSEACELEARALRREAAEGLSALDPHLRFAHSLGRLVGPGEAALLDLRA